MGVSSWTSREPSSHLTSWKSFSELAHTILSLRGLDTFGHSKWVGVCQINFFLRNIPLVFPYDSIIPCISLYRTTWRWIKGFGGGIRNALNQRKIEVEKTLETINLVLHFSDEDIEDLGPRGAWSNVPSHIESWMQWEPALPPADSQPSAHPVHQSWNPSCLCDLAAGPGQVTIILCPVASSLLCTAEWQC